MVSKITAPTPFEKKRLLEHFVDLKQKLLPVMVFYLIAAAISYFYVENIYDILLLPLQKNNQLETRKLIYTGMAEAFFTYIKLALYSAFFLTVPIIALQIYRFIAPGLYQTERLLAAILLASAPLLFYLGASFVFFFVMPKAWEFFLSFENQHAMLPLVLEARISEYLKLVTQLIIAFGLAFELPVVFVLLTIMGLLSSQTLRTSRRLAVVVIFILAAILTPPDVISQIALALPMLLLYEVSMRLCVMIERRANNNAGYKVDKGK